MAKKKKEYDPNDTTTWDDEHWDKYIVDQVLSIARNLPYDKIVLCSIFTYAWWKAYGEGDRPTKGDVMLGVMYGLTIPPALQGGVVANTYATGAITALGLGIVKDQFLDIPDDQIQEQLDSVVESGFGWFDLYRKLKELLPRGQPGEIPDQSDLTS